MDIFLEYFGYVASLVILVSLLMSSIKKLRWINLFGAIMFSFYGFMIGSLPTGFMNFGIVIIDIYFLISIYSNKDYFTVLPIDSKSDYLQNFIKFYEKDLSLFNDQEDLVINDKDFRFFILRNAMPAGIFIAKEVNDKALEVVVDYVIPQYRDFKVGEFIYNKQKELFESRGYKYLVANTTNKTHMKYLLKMGFTQHEEDQNKYSREI
ncbi:hypothetical protein CI105_02620 [Candidatus Izimaplasma bacterium ZiA1]|uniref:hypothetical protein n=1 Tax=Candidatus Izimoplasma sp. ZiA1 TaxID=2024899 RepID=UPI000BAA3CA8|nr:hypothetical protein CI105_02620 [Candidatus Izimaplasma bacterium ZiA1]